MTADEATADTTGDAVRATIDRESIRQAMLRYCRGVDRGDAELIASAYHSDAVDEHGSSTFRGADIGPGIAGLVRASRISLHMVNNQLIEFTGPDRAGSETYYTAWQTVEGDGAEGLLRALGRYIDRFERRDGQWRIAHRLVIVEHTHVIPADDAFPPSQPGLGSRDRNDPSYAALSGDGWADDRRT